MKTKRTCNGCGLLGIAKTFEGSWHICKHGSFTEIFIQGRALDLAEFPEWCPKKPKQVVDLGKSLTDLFDKDEIEVTTSSNSCTGTCVATVLHKATGVSVKVNEYKTIHKNLNTALVRLHAQLLDD